MFLIFCIQYPFAATDKVVGYYQEQFLDCYCTECDTKYKKDIISLMDLPLVCNKIQQVLQGIKWQILFYLPKILFYFGKTLFYFVLFVRDLPLRGLRSTSKCSDTPQPPDRVANSWDFERFWLDVGELMRTCIRRTFLPQIQTSKEGVRLVHEYVWLLKMHLMAVL